MVVGLWHVRLRRCNGAIYSFNLCKPTTIIRYTDKVCCFILNCAVTEIMHVGLSLDIVRIRVCGDANRS